MKKNAYLILITNFLGFAVSVDCGWSSVHFSTSLLHSLLALHIIIRIFTPYVYIMENHSTHNDIYSYYRICKDILRKEVKLVSKHFSGTRLKMGSRHSSGLY